MAGAKDRVMPRWVYRQTGQMVQEAGPRTKPQFGLSSWAPFPRTRVSGAAWASQASDPPPYMALLLTHSPQNFKTHTKSISFSKEFSTV